MKKTERISEIVKTSYHRDDVNCATTSLRVLSECFDVELNPQVFDAAVGMHGAGKFGAQCGLVEGSLLFLGISGRERGLSDTVIADLCRDFAESFEREFSSLECRVLRPEGFLPDNPPHLCEKLTCKAIEFSVNFIEKTGADARW